MPFVNPMASISWFLGMAKRHIYEKKKKQEYFISQFSRNYISDIVYFRIALKCWSPCVEEILGNVSKRHNHIRDNATNCFHTYRLS